MTGRDERANWRFADAELMAAERELRIGGRKVVLDRSATDVLVCLLERAGETVSKPELLRAGWPGRVVTENSLSKAIARIRAALDDGDGRIVESVHGYGYRIAGTVSRAHQAPASAPPEPEPEPAEPSLAPPAAAPRRRGFPSRWIAPGFVAVAVAVVMAVSAIGWARRDTGAQSDAATIHSVAIRPFLSLSDTAADTAIAESITQKLSADLLLMPRFRVVPPHVAAAPAENPSDLRAIGKALGVAAVLSGTMTSADGRLRLTVMLSRTHDASLLWTEAFDRPAAELASLKHDLGAAVTRALTFHLAPGNFEGVGRGTRNADAYAQFVNGAYLFKDDETGGRRALVAYERAVAIDPDYTEAWLRIADVLSHNGFYATDAQEALNGKKRAMAIIERVLTTDPDHVAALHMRAGLRYSHWWDWDGAIADYTRLSELGHGEDFMTRLNRVRVTAALGRIDEALTLVRQLQADTDNADVHALAAYLELSLGRLGVARDAAARATAADPLDEHARYYAGLCDLLEGQVDGALAHFDDSAHVLRLTGRASALHTAGDRAGSDRELAVLVSRYGHLDAFRIAQVHAWRGEHDLAFEWLERALVQHEASTMYLKFDPLLASIRGDARFSDILRRVNLLQEPEIRPADARPATGIRAGT
jgi:DNA-binding winged helix-turn-helix (wHTH) protein/TolB-like protein